MLPTTEDLPADDWRVLGQRTWRMGRLGPPSEAGGRAAALGLVTALRSFQNGRESRWLVAQVLPLASELDAQGALSDFPGRFIRNPRAQVTLVKESQVEPPTVQDGSQALAIERETTGRFGDHVSQLLLVCIDSTVAMLSASGHEDWSWSEVGLVADSFARRVKAAANVV